MAITYEWDVSQVETYPTLDSNVDVIHKVNWRLTALDGENNDPTGTIPITAQGGGVVVIDTSDLSSFVAFSDITTADVQGWVDAELGADMIANLKTNLVATITEIVTPSSVTKTIGE